MLPKPTKFLNAVVKSGQAIALGLLFLLGMAATTAHALDYRAVAAAKVVSYDAPSKQASKLFILSAGYPLEVIVNLGDWLKVRDATGSLSWVESKLLNSKRMALVLTKTEIKASPDTTGALVATVDKDVLLELLTGAANHGWVKVKHRDGATGYVPIDTLWGAN